MIKVYNYILLNWNNNEWTNYLHSSQNITDESVK
jgi:hypothetical protein